MSKTRADFELDDTPPRSIRDIVLEEISYTVYDGKTSNPLAVENVSELSETESKRIFGDALPHGLTLISH